MEDQLAEELGGGGGGGGQEDHLDLGPKSPVTLRPRKETGRGKRRTASPARGESSPKRGASSNSQEDKDDTPERMDGGNSVLQEKKRNSDMYPAEERPPMFKDDSKFNSLSGDRAAKVCFSFYELSEKKKVKQTKQNTFEKSDDLIPTLKIPGGEDNAQDVVHEEARKMLRPVNKEIKELMTWFPIKRIEVIRNLPLSVYGLQDTVSTKAMELCHNLSSTLEIKMFSPSNLRSSATSQKQKAFTDDEGKLVLESADLYGELESVYDVMLAWNTLGNIWQKLFPEWPVAQIATRVFLEMKMFAHCHGKAREASILFSNRLLAANSQRAANRGGPVNMERAKNLAGTVCHGLGCSKDPPAFRKPALPSLTPDIAHPQSGGRGGRAGRGRGGGSRGGGGATPARASMWKLGDGSTVCRWELVIASGICSIVLWQVLQLW